MKHTTQAIIDHARHRRSVLRLAAPVRKALAVRLREVGRDKWLSEILIANVLRDRMKHTTS